VSKKEQSDSPKKRKGIVKMLVMGVLLIGAGGGSVFALMASGMLGHHGAAAAKERGPQLVLKGEEDPYALPPKKGEGEEAPMVHGDGGSKYRTAYYTFDEDFTSNLKDSDALIQVSLAASTRRDGRVLMWLDEHKLAIRSKILVVLADTPEDEVYSPDGKALLQKRLTKAVNDVLIQQEGFGGVDNIYFKTFIVQ
jgi:flagellar FliL protein